MILKMLIILSLFVSCQKKETDSLKINISNDISSHDPRKARTLNATMMMKMLYDGLTRISKDGKISNAIAEDIKISDDKKVYTFYLRKAFWSDGKRISSYDFAHSMKSSLSPSFPSSMAYQLFMIKGARAAKNGNIPVDEIGIKTPSENILVIELERPTPYFLEILSSPITFPVPRHMAGWEEGSFLGNGPFKIKEWNRSDRIELIKNENYWDSDSVKLKKISLIMVSEELELKMFEMKRLDWAGSPFSILPLDGFEKFSTSSSFLKKSLLGTAFLRVNVKKFDEIFSKEGAKEARLVLYNAIDRDSITKELLKGSQEKALSLIPNSMKIKISKKSIPLKKYEKKRLKLTYRNKQRAHLVAQEIAEEWRKKLGIDVTLEALEGKIYYSKIQKGDYDVALGSWIADFNDPISFLEVFKYRNNGTNNTNWENIEYIKLLDEAENADPKKRFKLFEKANNILREEMPIIPIYHMNLCYLKNPKLKDTFISPLGHVDFKWAYMEE